MKTYHYKHVIVHCGLHKTGSSYLQKVFLENTSKLAENSIHYPVIQPRERHNGNHSIAFVTYPPEADLAAHIKLRMQLASDCDTLLISAEGFPKVAIQSGTAERFASLFPKADIKFVLYLRRFDHHVESVYSERVKNNYCGDIDKMNYSHDMLRMLSEFPKAVGRKNIIVRPYNKSLWPDGSIGSDFFAAIDRPDVWKEMSTSGIDAVNTILSRPAIYLLSRTAKPAKKSLHQRLMNKPTMLQEDPARYFRSPDDRRAFNDLFKSHYQKISEEFALGDIGHFLDLNHYDDDPHWHPFNARQKAITRLKMVPRLGRLLF